MPAFRRLSPIAAALLVFLLAVPVSAAGPSDPASAGHGTGFVPTQGVTRGVQPNGNRLMASYAAVPEAVDLSAWAPPVGNQGYVGSCTSWATGYYERYWLRNKALGEKTLLAPMYLYSQIAKGVDRGSSFSSNFSIMVNQGIAPQSVYTQGNYDYTTQPTAAEVAAAAPYKATSYGALFFGPVSTAQATIQAAIASGQPVMIAIPVYPEFDRASASNPLIDVPTAGETSRGGHAVWAPRYDAQGLWIENSWGTGWGAAGWGHLTWAFVNQYAWEGWSLSSSTTDINPGTTTITSFYPTSGAVGTTVTLNGFALDGVTGVTFNGTAASFTVVSATQVTATVPSGATSGTIAVTTADSSASSATSFSVTLPASRLTYTGPLTVAPGSSVTLAARLTDASGTGIAGETVSFALNSALAGTAVTDAAGSATLSITAPATAGSYALSVSFAGDASYGASSTSATLKVATLTTSLRYTGALTVPRGTLLAMQATLLASTGAPVANQTVTFTFNGITYPAVTDASGIATASGIAQSRTGNFKVQVKFAGSTSFRSSSTSISVKVL